MGDCIFCRIVRGEVPASLLYQDDQVIAFEDINPAAPTHILIVPREHIPSVMGLEPAHEALAGRVFAAVRTLAAERGLNETGFRVVVNSGEQAGQTVPHLHFHLLGGRSMSWPPG